MLVYQRVVVVAVRRSAVHFLCPSCRRLHQNRGGHLGLPILQRGARMREPTGTHGVPVVVLTSGLVQNPIPKISHVLYIINYLYNI